MKDQETLNYERKIAATEAKLQKVSADMKALYREGQKLKRAARTHRLCNLGGLLESYLKEPDILEQDDVKRILDGVFADDRVQRALDRLIEQKHSGEFVVTIDDADETDEDVGYDKLVVVP